MKAEHIIAQMINVLPKKTNLFSSQISVSSMTFAAGVVTVETPTAHGVVNGKYVTITGALSKTQISSLTFSDGVATAVTATDHDLTVNWQDTVQIIGADQAEYNGTHELLSVPNRRTFTFAVSGTPASPATGSPTVLEDRIDTFNGRHQATVTSPTTFTYPSSFALSSSAGGNPVVNTEVRVSGAVTVDRAISSYTKKQTNELWAFVILGDTVVSRDRTIQSDADVNFTGTESLRIREIESFSVAVFIPSKDSISGRVARDMVDDIAVSFYKTLVGLKIPSAFSETREAIITPIGNKFLDYSTAVYIHQFDFQTVQDIISDDMVGPAENAAFRDAVVQFRNEYDELIMNTNVNLDEVQI